jgi:lipopolysaccharide export system protein LptA
MLIPNYLRLFFVPQARRNPTITLLFSLVCSVACASSSLAWALPEDADAPIVIRADTGEFDQKTNQATYAGDVQVDQGTMRVNAERMVVHRKDQKVTRIIFFGDATTPARYQQQLTLDEGQVKARADTITYHTQREVLDLEGRAFLSQQGNEVTGNTIKYDIVAGKVNATSKPNSGPIQMIIMPDGTTKLSP